MRLNAAKQIREISDSRIDLDDNDFLDIINKGLASEEDNEVQEEVMNLLRDNTDDENVKVDEDTEEDERLINT